MTDRTKTICPSIFDLGDIKTSNVYKKIDKMKEIR